MLCLLTPIICYRVKFYVCHHSHPDSHTSPCMLFVLWTEWNSVRNVSVKLTKWTAWFYCTDLQWSKSQFPLIAWHCLSLDCLSIYIFKNLRTVKRYPCLHLQWDFRSIAHKKVHLFILTSTVQWSPVKYTWSIFSSQLSQAQLYYIVRENWNFSSTKLGLPRGRISYFFNRCTKP